MRRWWAVICAAMAVAVVASLPPLERTTLKWDALMRISEEGEIALWYRRPDGSRVSVPLQPTRHFRVRDTELNESTVDVLSRAFKGLGGAILEGHEPGYDPLLRVELAAGLAMPVLELVQEAVKGGDFSVHERVVSTRGRNESTDVPFHPSSYGWSFRSPFDGTIGVGLDLNFEDDGAHGVLRFRLYPRPWNDDEPTWVPPAGASGRILIRADGTPLDLAPLISVLREISASIDDPRSIQVHIGPGTDEGEALWRMPARAVVDVGAELLAHPMVSTVWYSWR